VAQVLRLGIVTSLSWPTVNCGKPGVDSEIKLSLSHAGAGPGVCTGAGRWPGFAGLTRSLPVSGTQGTVTDRRRGQGPGPGPARALPGQPRSRLFPGRGSGPSPAVTPAAAVDSVTPAEVTLDSDFRVRAADLDSDSKQFGVRRAADSLTREGRRRGLTLIMMRVVAVAAARRRAGRTVTVSRRRRPPRRRAGNRIHCDGHSLPVPGPWPQASQTMPPT
jgi:hypothetical protein